ncbi:putative protein kinase RLK-Pelle-DLSV family [Helianthus debilis subsp. tardiflorus]
MSSTRDCPKHPRTDCNSLDTISTNQEIKDGKTTLVSEGEMFELGFFSPGKPKNRYMGIWYKKISYGTVVWVANRETPIADTSGLLKLTRLGNLVIRSGGNPMVWSSNPVVSMQGMKFGKDLVTGLQTIMTSWKSPDDPSVGVYSDVHDTNGYPQNLRFQGEVLIGRLGPWHGLGFSGFPLDKTNQIYSLDFVMNENEIYHIYKLKSSIVQRIILTWDGKTLTLQWIERIQDWIVYAESEVDNCDRFSLCGAYGICNINKHPPCSCMQGFEPRHPEEWEGSDWASGCKRKKPLNCGDGKGDGFLKIPGVKVPDTRRSWYNESMTLRDCEIACKRNCSCTGYANLDIRNGGSGCLLWLDELLDTRVYDGDQDLYIRMAASELEGVVNSRSNFNKVKRTLMVVLITSSVVPLLFAVAYAFRKTKKRPHMKSQGKWYLYDEKNTSLKMEQLDDLQCFSLYEVARATDNFSVSNKIGQGGFGPVYKCHLLADETRSLTLNWPQRLNIIHGIARGVLYLHQDSRLQIVHRDLKAGNILLDGDMNPKISDFGLARKFVGHDTTAKTKKVVGTYGYISPEYALQGHFSIKSDVFSFGVLVLEIICGQRIREFSHGDHYDNLLGHAWRLYKEGRTFELMSGSLQASCVVSEVLRSIHVALLCVQNHAEDRPTMLSVVLMLVGEGALPEPKQPAYFNEESCRELKILPSVAGCTITLLYAR